MRDKDPFHRYGHICVINESDFEDLLVIIKDQATSLELQVLEKKRPQISPVDRKYRSGRRPVQSFTTNITSAYSHCIVCSNRKHPVYTCDSSGAFLWMTKVFSETK